MSPRNQQPRTSSNTVGRVTVRQTVPKSDYRKGDFIRDLKKASRRLK